MGEGKEEEKGGRGEGGVDSHLNAHVYVTMFNRVIWFSSFCV